MINFKVMLNHLSANKKFFHSQFTIKNFYERILRIVSRFIYFNRRQIKPKVKFPRDVGIWVQVWLNVIIVDTSIIARFLAGNSSVNGVPRVTRTFKTIMIIGLITISKTNFGFLWIN